MRYALSSSPGYRPDPWKESDSRRNKFVSIQLYPAGHATYGRCPLNH